MIILKRHKDSNGNTVSYTLSNDGNIINMSSADTIKLSSLITNAYLTSNNEFRAKAGYSIETVVDTSNLSIRKNTKLEKVSNNIGLDYYGKEFINICRRIRTYAISKKVRVDKGRHRSNKGLNLNIYKLIETVGVDLDSFIIGYLSCIQPYCLSHFKKAPDKHIWLTGIGYNIALVIKIDESDKNSPLVISFHDSNKLGVSKKLNNTFDSKPCAVLIDSYKIVNNQYIVNYTVQRGFIRCNDLTSVTKYLNNDIALVSYKDISSIFDTILRNIFNNLQSNYLDINSIVNFDAKSLSFMSYGYHTTNNICMLIDLYSVYTDTVSRSAIVDIGINLIDELSVSKKSELKLALAERYSNYSNNLLDTIRGYL